MCYFACEAERGRDKHDVLTPPKSHPRSHEPGTLAVPRPLLLSSSLFSLSQPEVKTKNIRSQKAALKETASEAVGLCHLRPPEPVWNAVPCRVCHVSLHQTLSLGWPAGTLPFPGGPSWSMPVTAQGPGAGRIPRREHTSERAYPDPESRLVDLSTPQLTPWVSHVPHVM